MIALLTIMQSEDFTTSLSGDFAKSGAQMNPRGFFNAKKISMVTLGLTMYTEPGDELTIQVNSDGSITLLISDIEDGYLDKKIYNLNTDIDELRHYLGIMKQES